MKFFSVLLVLNIVVLYSVLAQDENNCTIEIELKHTPVINQGSTGTCWSFATTSFLESEIMRKGYPETDLSEMFFVYYAYRDKAEEYLFYHGNNNFSQGGQAHDVLNVLQGKGLVTNEAYPGKQEKGRFNHHELQNELNKEITALNKKEKSFESSDAKSFNSALNKYIGKVPHKIELNEKKFTPAGLLNNFEIDPEDYVEITSYSHHPFYRQFVLEIPDNWAHGLYYNLPIGELVQVMYFALENGYTVCWDGDTSEKGFNNRKGIAELPDKLKGKVDQKMRQETFLDRSTTDDHLMHIIGLSKNGEGESCFYTKNSWGADSNSMGGYLNMTEDYVRLKTIAIMVHKDAIPAAIKEKLHL